MSYCALLLAAIKGIDWVDNAYPELHAWDGIKTVAHYSRVLSRDVRDLYGGKLGEAEFVDGMAQLIEDQLTRAWNEGMRAEGFDPKTDMLPEWEALLQDTIAAEFDHVDQFAADILAAGKAGDPIDPLLGRVDLWVNRYNEVVNLAMMTCDKLQKLKWVYGDTDHCDTCLALNGVVATAEQWEASGYRPQSPPNDMLECGGWKCKCRLEKTDEPLTEGGIPDA